MNPRLSSTVLCERYLGFATECNEVSQRWRPRGKRPSDLDIDRMVAGLGAATEADEERPDKQSR
jgi:hypothetical protein